MKVGLLECDHVLDKYRPVAGDYRDMFPALLPGLEFTLFDICNGHFPASTDDCDAWLCTGSKYSVYDEIDWIRQLKAFVRQLHKADKLFVGVCFGHQMLGEALGGKVQRADIGWCVGAHTFEITQQESWMKPFQSPFNLLMLCQDQVQTLPENSTVLARATHCPVGMFRVGERMLGIQAHPEFPPEYLKVVLPNRIERVGRRKTESALKSLGQPLHRKLIAEWVEHFLTQNFTG